MNIKSLMIGDYVQMKVLRMNKLFEKEAVMMPYKVVEVRESLVLERVNTIGDDDRYITISCSYVVEPIPLTKKILEKNGFKDIGDSTYQLEEKPYWFWVDFFNRQYGCEYDTSTHEYEDEEHRLKLYGIPSVHELQNAMRICGIEKEIEL